MAIMVDTPETPTQAKDPMRQRLASVPARPGVYLFKNATSQFIYVGKASNLRNAFARTSARPSALSPRSGA